MLSVIIIAKNEEKNIRRCLESVAWADELIVLDSGSTDNTVAIAKQFTKHVYSTDWQGYGVQKQRALSYASKTWVLNLDADESVDDQLKNEMIQAMQDVDVDGYKVPIQMYFYGKPLRFCSSPKRHIRLFKRLGASFSDDLVHEKIQLPNHAKISKLSNSIVHHSFQDVSHALYKMNKYSSYSAKIKLNNHKKMSFSRMLASTSWMFFRCYIIQFGLLDGKAGFLFAVLNAQGSFYRGIKQLYPDKDY